MPTAIKSWRPGALVAVLLAAGSTGAGHPASALPAEFEPLPPAERLVLATFASTAPEYWQRAVRELSGRLALRVRVAWAMESLREECVIFELPEKRSANEIVKILSADPRVTYAGPVHRFRTLGSPWNDAYASMQHGLETLGLAAAHQRASGRGVRVAVIDTGIDLAHPDFEGRIKVAKNFVEQGGKSFTTDAHGTAVAGIVAASANNAIGIVGVAPQAELLALRACWPDSPGARQATCDSYTIASALDFALTSGARILNLSLAGPEDGLVARLLARAEELGVVAVAAVDEEGVATFPASLPTVLGARAASAQAAVQASVAAASGNELTAPGVEVLTTGPNGSYDFFSGSSMAAAHVSGVAALLLERNSGLTPARVRELLVERRPGGASGGHPLSACGALAALLGEAVCN